MRYLVPIIVVICIVQVSIIGPKMDTALAKNIQQNDLKEKQDNDQKLQNRIDFGSAYILGQTIKSGAVYLLQRKKSEIESMLNYRKNYRKEILEDFNILDERIDRDEVN